jgi:hypothetical protein
MDSTKDKPHLAVPGERRLVRWGQPGVGGTVVLHSNHAVQSRPSTTRGVSEALNSDALKYAGHESDCEPCFRTLVACAVLLAGLEHLSLPSSVARLYVGSRRAFR